MLRVVSLHSELGYKKTKIKNIQSTCIGRLCCSSQKVWTAKHSSMILNKYLTLWQCDNLNLCLSAQNMPDFSRDVSKFRWISVGCRSQLMCSCLQGDYDLMNNRSQFYSMCEYVYEVWHVRNVGNSFILPSMKAYEKSLSKSRQFLKPCKKVYKPCSLHSQGLTNS